ncbi:ABC transporter ATP-binding protein [Halovenus salina]|uniref:ABC transporter ATP-binding protein n=1 Tax=Halovenus salina TaxID=1510225 RepID=A0ABD5VZD6_9EURY|nr:ABC transporter ATP-binding protein [Halovenus salina]
MLVTAENVTKQFTGGADTVQALETVDLAIEAGEFVAVVGPSGSGKSTLLNLLGLLDTPTSGTVTLNGTDVESYSDRERTSVRQDTIGFVFQSYGLIPTLTALENVAVPRMLEPNPSATEERAAELLEAVGLGDRLDHYPDELSGGQKQRVAIGRALVNEPDLILADEPTGNLDRGTGERVLSTLLESTDEDVTVVAVTHDEYVAGFSDRVLNLVDGTLQPADEEAMAPGPDASGTAVAQAGDSGPRDKAGDDVGGEGQ